VQERIIQADRAIGDKWLVTGGLKKGDRVVVEGLQGIRPGAKPQVNEVSVAEFDKRSAQITATQS